MIFISYRRDDSAIFTGRLYDRLAEAYGASRVFLDIHSIHASVDFRKAIANQLKSSRVVLAVIGPRWRELLQQARSASEPDYLRIELEQALEQRCQVVPVYSDDMPFLSESELAGDSLAPLVFANAVKVLPGADFDAHTAGLIREIDRLLYPSLPVRWLGIVQRQVRRQRVAAVLVMLLLLLILTFRLVGPFRDWSMSRLLRFGDPTLFQGSASGEYRVARMFPGSHAVREQSTFGQDAAQTRTEFCMFANTFGFYRDQVVVFEQLAQRGVKLRFIVSAFEEESRVHWETFARLTGEANIDETISQAKNIRCLIHKLREKYPNHVELRLNREPLFYTMWLRDPHEPTGIGHVGLHYYADKSRWPSFRVSQITGKEMLPIMAEQFELAWKKAKPADPSECQPNR